MLVGHTVHLRGDGQKAFVGYEKNVPLYLSIPLPTPSVYRHNIPALLPTRNISIAGLQRYQSAWVSDPGRGHLPQQLLLAWPVLLPTRHFSLGGRNIWRHQGISRSRRRALQIRL